MRIRKTLLPPKQPLNLLQVVQPLMKLSMLPVSSRIVNVETGEIEKTEVYDHIGDIGQLLTNGMRMVAIGLTK